MHGTIVFAFALVQTAIGGFTDSGDTSGWQTMLDSYRSGFQGFGQQDNEMQESFLHSSNFQQLGHQQSSNFGLFDSGHNNFHDHGGLFHSSGRGSGGWEQHQYVHSVPIGQHVEVTNSVPIPVYKNIGVPVAQPVAIRVPQPVAIGVSQPYPVHVPVSHPVAIPVIKTIAVPVEKKVPYPVEKIIPVPVEKPVPITIEKHIPVPVEKPYPIHIPVYKHIFHRPKHHHHGWER